MPNHHRVRSTAASEAMRNASLPRISPAVMDIVRKGTTTRHAHGGVVLWISYRTAVTGSVSAVVVGASGGAVLPSMRAYHPVVPVLFLQKGHYF